MRGSSHKHTSLWLATSTIGILSLALCYHYCQSSSNNDDDNEDEVDPNLPPHLKRAIHKEKRRQQSVRFLAMKKPMYDNFKMYAPNGDLLSKRKLSGTSRKNWPIGEPTEAAFNSDLNPKENRPTIKENTILLKNAMFVSVVEKLNIICDTTSYPHATDDCSPQDTNPTCLMTLSFYVPTVI